MLFLAASAFPGKLPIPNLGERNALVSESGEGKVLSKVGSFCNKQEVQQIR